MRRALAASACLAAASIVVLTAAGVAARTASEPSPAGPSSGEAVAGELTRVDLSRRSVFVKTEGREPRELEAGTTSATRVVSRGRTARLEDLRPGDRVVVVAAVEGGKRVARIIKVAGHVAIASPSAPPPSPRPPASSGGAGGGG